MENNNNIVVELNNKKYLLVEVLVTSGNSKKLELQCKKYNCITQGIKEIKQGGWFSNAYVILKILVPEENIITWNDEDYL